MTSLLDLAVAGLFIFWIILTVINQFDYSWVQRIRKYDFFYLLPRWTFFAPNPGTSDYHFLYRQMDIHDQLSDFTEIALYDKKHLVSAFWNPDKRVKKALTDLVMDLNRLCSSGEFNAENIKISFSYIALLNFLSKIPKSPTIKSVQFAILKSNGFIDSGKPTLIITSAFHHV